MAKRIFLHPGEVLSQYDGQIHYIPAPKLARLYGVNYRECFVIYYDRPETSLGHIEKVDDIHLYPRYDGNYTTPKTD